MPLKEVLNMENARELLQVMIRRLGLLDKNCCSAGSTNLTLVQSHILYEADRKENPSIQEMADLMGTDITTFSRQIQGMVKMGLLEKKQSFEDKRVYHVHLTAAGKAISSTIDAQMNQYLAEVFGYMSQEEQEQVIQSLQILNRSMAKSPLCCRPVQ